MVITNLQQKQNRKIWVPIRGGNRGGWSLFNWEDVRDKPYKQRQMYLGNSATLGVLDRGGKWRKRDWYMKTDKRYHSDDLKSQQQQVIRKDYERMHAALNMNDRDDEQKLTQQQMRELMKKIKMKKQDMDFAPPAPDAIGLGFDKMKVQIRSNPSAKIQNPHRLQAIDDFQTKRQQKKQKLQKKQQKRQKQKKQKKQKKHKQQKDRKRDNSQQSSHTKKKKKKQKHHKRDKQQKKQRSKQKQLNNKKQDKHERHRDRSRQKKRYSYSASSSRSI